MGLREPSGTGCLPRTAWPGLPSSCPSPSPAPSPPLQLREAQQAYEGARRTAQQLKRKGQQLTRDLEDTRVLAESQQARSHELEKKQKK